MPRYSAGVLPFRFDGGAGDVLVFVAHPGGPFWAKKDAGCWSLVKGEYDPDEEPRSAAAREFREEIGVEAPAGEWLDLGEVRQSSAKVVRAFAVEAPAELRYRESNLVDIEWPPRSGRRMSIPEVDRAEWMALDEARPRLVAGQRELLDRLMDRLRSADRPPF